MPAPAAPTPPIGNDWPGGIAPPRGGVADKGFDISAWLNQQEPTWTAWTVGVGLGALCVVFGLRGIYAFWRGEPPDKEKGIPALPLSLGLLIFGGWVLLVFGISGLPG